MEQECCKQKEVDNKTKNTGQIVMLVLVGLLLVFSVVQAFQINGIKGGVATGQVTGFASAPSPVQAVPVAQAPAMVGGC